MQTSSEKSAYQGTIADQAAMTGDTVLTRCNGHYTGQFSIPQLNQDDYTAALQHY